MADSTDIFWPLGLPIPLLAPKFEPRSRTIRTEMDSRRIRARRAALTPREMIQVAWRFTGDQYATFETFFKGTLQNGSFAFQLPIQGNGGVIDRKVSFVDSTYQLDHSDNLFSVTASVEALESETY